MRKRLSILLLAFIVLPFAASLAAAQAPTDAGLPACCRRNGAHHCSMGMAERTRLSPLTHPAFHAPIGKCPFYPGTIAASHPNLGLLPTADAIFAALVSHPTAVAQTESLWRIARDRSRSKRGPPLHLL